jgi:hypothetical protein
METSIRIVLILFFIQFLLLTIAIGIALILVRSEAPAGGCKVWKRRFKRTPAAALEPRDDRPR